MVSKLFAFFYASHSFHQRTVIGGRRTAGNGEGYSVLPYLMILEEVVALPKPRFYEDILPSRH